MRSAKEILEHAAHLVAGPRAVMHGDKRATHQTIAELWSVYLERRQPGPLSPVDVLHMMVLLKLGRTLHGLVTNLDNWVDMAGYAGMAGELAAGPAPQPAAERTP